MTKINFLISLIDKAKYIISNDTGPAHICSHLKKDGLVLFGSHTTAKKVNIGNEKFKPITVEKLTELKTDKVIQEIQKDLN